MSSDDVIIEDVQSSFQKLSLAARDLNAVSDQLGQCVGDLDAALKKLNLGITTWVTIRSGEDAAGDGGYWSEGIGYAKVSGKWGICLRTLSGHVQFPDEESVEAWLFGDAPRSLRLSGIDKIPELLEKLSVEATESTKKIGANLHKARAVAEAIKGPTLNGWGVAPTKPVDVVPSKLAEEAKRKWK